MLAMFKLIASLLVICSAGLAGMLAASAYSLRSRQLRTLQEALQLLDTEIMYGATPSAGCTLQGGRPRPGMLWALCFVKPAMLLGKSGGITAGEAWSLAVDAEHSPDGFYPGRPGDPALIRRGSLGSSDRAEQHKHITLTTYHLRQDEEKAEGERQKNERIWQYGGFLVGISIVLLLL